MKLVRATKTKLLFQLGRREDRLFREVLKLYPRVPSAHHVLSKSGRLPHREADQRLLDEALAEQRAEHKQQVAALLADPRRLAPAESGSHLSLRHTEVEWLLAGAQRHPGRELDHPRFARGKAARGERSQRTPLLGDGAGRAFSSAVA